jgi:hypothetical protein
VKTAILIGLLASILSATMAHAGNHALYTQLRQQARAAYYAQQDREMVAREQLKLQRAMRQRYDRIAEAEGRRKAKAKEVADREARRNHPAAAFGEEPIIRPGVPDAQM